MFSYLSAVCFNWPFQNYQLTNIPLSSHFNRVIFSTDNIYFVVILTLIVLGISSAILALLFLFSILEVKSCMNMGNLINLVYHNIYSPFGLASFLVIQPIIIKSMESSSILNQLFIGLYQISLGIIIFNELHQYTSVRDFSLISTK